MSRAVPTELKVLNGNPGHRRIPNSPPGTKPRTIPPTPVGLGPIGSEAWTLYWTHGRTWLALTDAPHVARLCKLMDLADTCEKTLAEEGMLHKNPKTKRSAAHFLLSQLLGLYNTINDLEASCGFTPSDRSRMKAEPEDQGDALDKWQAGKTG